MKVGSIIYWHGSDFQHHRFYEVQGIHLGGDGQVSLVEIRSLTERDGAAHGQTISSMFVPEPLLRDAAVYSPDIRR